MMTTAQAAAELGISARRVQALIAAGRLAAVKAGRDWLIDPRALASVRNRPNGRPPGKKTRKNRKNSAKSI